MRPAAAAGQRPLPPEAVGRCRRRILGSPVARRRRPSSGGSGEPGPRRPPGPAASVRAAPPRCPPTDGRDRWPFHQVLANRAAAALAAGWHSECIADCDAAARCWAAASGVAGAAAADKLRAKVDHRREAARSAIAAAAQAAAAAEGARGGQAFGPAIAAYAEALALADAGAAGGPLRGLLFRGRSECLAAVGGFGPALADAQQALRLRPGDGVAAAAVARLSTIAGGGDGGGGGAGSGCGEGAEILDGMSEILDGLPMAHGRATRRVVQVCEGLAVTLQEVFVGSTGGRLWDAALLLTHWLCSPASAPGAAALGRAVAAGGRVLEVGAGVGLVGLAAAAVLPAAAAAMGRPDGWGVALTDIDPEVLHNLSLSIALNGGGSRVSVASLDYGTAASAEAVAGQLSLGRFDLILGADVVYGDSHAGLAAALARLLAVPDGQAVSSAIGTALEAIWFSEGLVRMAHDDAVANGAGALPCGQAGRDGQAAGGGGGGWARGDSAAGGR